MASKFFAILSRLKYINRWALMRNTHTENLSEHTLDTAYIAQALVIIDKSRFGGKLNPEHAAVLAMYHDVSEILTGDMPTPVKYFNADLKKAYKAAEKSAAKKLINHLPDDMKNEIGGYIDPKCDDEYKPFIKAADRLSAVIKCIEERKTGNREFLAAEEAQMKAIKEMNLPAVNVFVDEFLPAYSLSLDELN
ncbi:MAG: 5'-deoxynucleotidase [Clostridia bacterium]|nr:5'-deoxynucleotidase [Clostridia bacterium]